MGDKSVGKESVTPGIKHKSFKACGIGVGINGSKDCKIHCLRQGGVVTVAAPENSRLATEMLKAEAADMDEPFAGLDDDELDANELVIGGEVWTQTAKPHAVTIFMAQWTRIFTLH